ncbi:potassium channel family protein [Cellulomonas rhizosphaerae]|uniref:Two pore domain potassium channel family protein n=1 Tax=Cellulomonas rhizosphaerae TaxID=2293719 RepID=A0A413RM70_9CELL|nr:potassium channel family protein [Cellulomonas rhizosphaerae]RHA41618.1 two pore domain potassium channel family protein [Cellulomonas rhizosphaerae]
MRTSEHLRGSTKLRPEPDHFGIVLLMLVVAYVLSVLSSSNLSRVIVGALYVGALVYAVRASQPGPGLRQVLRVVIVGGAVAIVGAALFLPHDDASGVIDCVLVLVLLSALICIFDRIITAQDVTGRLIAGALSAYLMVGMLFASVFGVLAWLQGSFFANGQQADAESLQYFSFVTLTTLGYGDLVTVSSAGRGLAALEALVGQVFLATLIARLVGSFRRPTPTRRQPPEDSDPT